uniref:Uncharacterized protein n=1 Tax=Rhodnius prolixus TaxID=13249 RepID=T1HVY6_RHOPR
MADKRTGMMLQVLMEVFTACSSNLQSGISNVVDDIQKVKGKFYSLIQPSVPVKPWFAVFTENRGFYCTMSRLRFNHNYSPHHHLARIGIEINPICSCDRESTAEANLGL